MSLRLPVVCFAAETNVETTEGKSLYFKDAEGLALILRDLTEDKLAGLAKDMREIAERRYRWDIICGKYAELLRS